MSEQILDEKDKKTVAVFFSKTYYLHQIVSHQIFSNLNGVCGGTFA